MLPIPRVSKPPLIIDPVEFAIGPIFKVSIQKFIAHWFGIFLSWGRIVDDDVDKLVFIHRMPQQVEHVTGDAVVTPPAVGGIVVPAMLDLASKGFVL